MGTNVVHSPTTTSLLQSLTLDPNRHPGAYPPRQGLSEWVGTCPADYLFNNLAQGLSFNKAKQAERRIPYAMRYMVGGAVYERPQEKEEDSHGKTVVYNISTPAGAKQQPGQD